MKYLTTLMLLFLLQGVGVASFRTPALGNVPAQNHSNTTATTMLDQQKLQMELHRLKAQIATLHTQIQDLHRELTFARRTGLTRDQMDSIKDAMNRKKEEILTHQNEVERLKRKYTTL